MDIAKVTRSLAFISLSVFFCVCSYEIPDVQIQALSPKGLRASIPDAPGIGLFAFQGNINRRIGKTDVGVISGTAAQPTNGQWVFEDPTVEVVGDVINYYVFVSANSFGYTKDDLSFTVTSLGEPSTSGCKSSVTHVRGGTACAGQTIFEDNFDSLNKDLWQIEQFIPSDHPEYPFISYQASRVSVANGQLSIAPGLQKDQPGFNNDTIYMGSLDLINGCTSSANECSFQAWGASILPPVASGRLISRFAFTYGTVHIRAKVPQGDWLYPEVLLEPFLKKYGRTGYSSGVLKIASARGNKDLKIGVKDFGNCLLYGGPIIDYACRQYLLVDKKMSVGKNWGDEFHVYTVNWAPERITLSVDSEEWARIEPANGGLRGHLSSTCEDLPHNQRTTGSSLAPFDDYCYITLGVAAGGISEFDDAALTPRGPKPWRNQARKASMTFWQDMPTWYPTWTNPALIVDYVRVVAL